MLIELFILLMPIHEKLLNYGKGKGQYPGDF